MENSNKEATITSEQAWFNINKDNNMTISVIPSNTKNKRISQADVCRYKRAIKLVIVSNIF